MGKKLGSTPRLSTRISWGVLPGYARVCGAFAELLPRFLPGGSANGAGELYWAPNSATKKHSRQQTAPWTYPPGGVRRGEEGVQQHLRLGRKLGGVLPGSAHALAGEYSPAMHVGAEHVRGASSPLPPLREQLCQRGASNSSHQRSTKPQHAAANSITTHYLLYVALARGYGTAALSAALSAD